jgi:hypothetical protein
VRRCAPSEPDLLLRGDATHIDGGLEPSGRQTEARRFEVGGRSSSTRIRRPRRFDVTPRSRYDLTRQLLQDGGSNPVEMLIRSGQFGDLSLE